MSVVENIKQDSTTIAGTLLLSEVLKQVGEIVKELEKVAISSPFASFAVTLAVVDILHNYKIVSDNTFKIIVFGGTAGFSISIVGDIISEAAQISHVAGNTSAQPSLFSNSVQTLVTVQGHEDAQLNALLARR